ncbi:MAG TPA: hypothetical protein VNO75_10505 [Gemmatimonadaceae bacterium]|nr:hypothetical protein [Gemmatimonadaceae bacterium]
MNLSLAQAIFWIAALACVVAQLALLRSSLATRAQPESDLVPASPRPVELAWSILPAVALSALLFFTWKRVAAADEHAHMDHAAVSAPAPDEAPTPHHSGT